VILRLFCPLFVAFFAKTGLVLTQKTPQSVKKSCKIKAQQKFLTALKHRAAPEALKNQKARSVRKKHSGHRRKLLLREIVKRAA
jgi:hypothetical protein